MMLVAGHALGDNGMDSPFVGQKKKKKVERGVSARDFVERLLNAKQQTDTPCPTMVELLETF